MRAWLLALLLCLVAPATLAEGCWDNLPDPPKSLRLFEDRGAALSIEQVLALAEQAFVTLPERRMFSRYSESAFWLRFSLDSRHELDCVRWLTVGDPRLSDLRVFVERDGDWREMRAGAAHPAAQWPVLDRQPLFPLDPQHDRTVVIRASGKTQIQIEPLLWSAKELLIQRQHDYLGDGLSLGIVTLVVALSFIVGLIMQSRLLLAHAAAVFSCILGTALASGYLVQWPALLAWDTPIWALTRVLGFACFLGYIRVLLRVAELRAGWRWSYAGLLLGYAASHAWLALVDHVQGHLLADLLTGLALYVLLPLTLLESWRRGLRLVWMAWLVPALYLLLGGMQLLEPASWQAHQDFFSLSSSLPGVALLVCTLVTELYRSRGRERWAQEQLKSHRQAEQERLEGAVAQRTEQLRESLEARNALLERISHDLRTPLLEIIEQVRALAAGGRNDYPQRIARNAQRQLELVDGLLEFSRSDQPKLEPCPVAGHLPRFLDEISDEAEVLARRGGNDFELHYDALPDWVRADFRYLRQVLINLLGNSAKFTSQGRIALTVRCLRREGGAVTLEFRVDDSGIGIHPDDRARLQEPFIRGRNAECAEGVGLGLAIVSRLLQDMGSVLRLEDDGRPGCHLGFELRLPLLHPGERRVAQSSEASRVAETKANDGGLLRKRSHSAD